MITVKTLSGDLISLPKENPEKVYLETYVKEKFRPFTIVHIQEYEGQNILLVNVHEIHPLLCELEHSIAVKAAISSNPEAIRFLKKNPKYISWIHLCLNPSGIEILRDNLDKVSWEHLSYNPSALELLRLSPEKAYWECAASWIKELSDIPQEYMSIRVARGLLDNPLCQPEWIEPWMDQLDEIDWEVICILESPVIGLINKCPISLLDSDPNIWKFISSNSSPLISRLLEENVNKLNLEKICTYQKEDGLRRLLPHFSLDKFSRNHIVALNRNPDAIFFLKQNPKFTDVKELSTNPNGSEILRLCPEKINWHKFSAHTKDMDYLEENIEKVDWGQVSKNIHATDFLCRHQERVKELVISDTNAVPILMKAPELFYKFSVSTLSFLGQPGIFCPPLDDF